MSGTNTYSHLGLPSEVTVILFTLSLIASLVPVCSGADFGIFKVPLLRPNIQRWLKIIGPISLVIIVAAFLPVWPKPDYVKPQQVRWAPLDGEDPGIAVYESQDTPRTFIPWTKLKPEIEKRLFPQVVQIPAGSNSQLASFREKQNWVVEVVGPNGQKVSNVWFGTDPNNHWTFDGLIRVGLADPEERTHPVVWQSFQRYSDGSYRRRK